MGTILGNGLPITIQAVPGCVVTVTIVSAPPFGTRFVFAQRATSTTSTFTTCPLSAPPPGCGFSTRYWYQIESNHQAIARGQTSFDEGLTFAVNGTSTGVGQTICSLVTTSFTLGAATCSG